MDEEEMELKNGLTDPHEELKIEYEPSDELSVLSSIENIDMPYEEIEIKDEPIDKGFILASIDGTNMEISSNSSIIKQEVSVTNTKRFEESETNETGVTTNANVAALNNVTVVTKIMTNSKTFDGHEDLEESGISVKSETDVKPKIIFGFSESDSNHTMSTVSKDPLDITVHEEKSKTKTKCFHCPALLNTALELKKHFTAEHEVGKKVKKDNMCAICLKVINKSHDLQRHRIRIHAFECQFCPLKFVLKRDMYDHVKVVHSNDHDQKYRINIKCSFCPRRFVATLDLKKHLDTEHKVVMKIKNKIREEPNESNVPLKKFKQKGSFHQSMSFGEEFDTNIQNELNEKSISNDQNQTENTNFMNSSICPKTKEGTSEICDKSEVFSESEKFEESGIFVKSETDIKSEILHNSHPNLTISNK